MKFSLLSAAVLPAAVAAHNINLEARHGNVVRQNSAPAAAPAASSPAAAPPPASPTAAPVSVSLHSVNPTAIPLASLTAGTLTNQQTLGASTTYIAGATPSAFPNAPPLPDISTLNPANYPTLDVIPPTDSPEVQQWIKEVNASGVPIPNITPTKDGTCGGDPAAAADQSRCWWTCGGCVRDTDVTTCQNKFTWGLTYDDGPAPYTPNLLQYLDQQNLKATFFVVGSRVISYPALAREEYMAGHQLAVHTWSHHTLTAMTNEQIIAEFGWSRKIIKDVVGVTPKFWRPPFGDIDDRVRAIGLAMGMAPVIWTRISPTATFDTGDFNIGAGTITAPQVLQNWENIIANASTINTGFIVLEHDLFEQSVDIATGYILPDALSTTPKLTIEPVIQCMGRTAADAYIETNDNKTYPPTTSTNSTSSSSGSAGQAQASGGSDSGSGGAASPSGAAPISVSGSLALASSVMFAALLGFSVWL
ncbi:hypothetical protein BDW22DRAFT_1113490 [Trametopsis cervina]|nr:hypothetical protein BDW22DRAFT_1113490 [Trametopsis cervina]